MEPTRTIPSTASTTPPAANTECKSASTSHSSSAAYASNPAGQHTGYLTGLVESRVYARLDASYAKAQNSPSIGRWVSSGYRLGFLGTGALFLAAKATDAFVLGSFLTVVDLLTLGKYQGSSLTHTLSEAAGPQHALTPWSLQAWATDQMREMGLEEVPNFVQTTLGGFVKRSAVCTAATLWVLASSPFYAAWKVTKTAVALFVAAPALLHTRLTSKWAVKTLYEAHLDVAYSALRHAFNPARVLLSLDGDDTDDGDEDNVASKASQQPENNKITHFVQERSIFADLETNYTDTKNMGRLKRHIGYRIAFTAQFVALLVAKVIETPLEIIGTAFDCLRATGKAIQKAGKQLLSSTLDLSTHLVQKASTVAFGALFFIPTALHNDQLQIAKLRLHFAEKQLSLAVVDNHSLESNASSAREGAVRRSPDQLQPTGSFENVFTCFMRVINLSYSPPPNLSLQDDFAVSHLKGRQPIALSPVVGEQEADIDLFGDEPSSHAHGGVDRISERGYRARGPVPSVPSSH